MEGLKRCPFCGGKAREFIDAAVVGCMRCPAEVRGESPAEAVAAWNRRASDAAMAKAREAIAPLSEAFAESTVMHAMVMKALAALKEVAE